MYSHLNILFLREVRSWRVACRLRVLCAPAQRLVAVTMPCFGLADMFLGSTTVFTLVLVVRKAAISVIKKVYVGKSDHSRARADANNRVVHGRIRLRKQHDHGKPSDYCDHGSSVRFWSGGVYSEGYEMEPIALDRGGRHVVQIMTTAMYVVRQQEA